MTDKERLEEIKEKYNLGSINRFVDVKLVNPQELKWLIEQSERVQELESRIDNDEHFVAEILEQNKRYREAIEVAIHNMAASDNLGVKFVLGILEQALESEENESHFPKRAEVSE